MSAVQQTLPLTEAQSEFNSIFGEWQTTPSGGYSTDQVIEAYVIGKERGKTEERKLLGKIFKSNIKKAVSFSEEKYKGMINVFNCHPTAMKMRILSISSFEVLIVLPEREYLSDEIEKIYSYLIEAMTSINGPDFNWSFMLMSNTSALNEEAIESDGFTLNYAATV